MPTSILVLGAGELGTAVLHHLATHPQRTSTSTTLTLLLRPSSLNPTSPQKQAENAALRNLGISFLAGDIATASIDELASLFQPYDTIISCTGFVTGPGTQIKLAQAVLAAGTVKRYFPWQFGVDYDVVGWGSAQDLFDEQLDVRDLLRGQRQVEWVIVSTGMFMSFLFQAFFGVVDLTGEEKVVRALGNWETQVTLTTPEDIGKITAEVVFAAEPSIKDEVVFTAGDTVSYGEVAEVVDEVLGIEARREVWTVEELERRLKEDPENSVNKYRVVFAKGKGVAWDKEKTFNAQNGIEVTSMKEWALENLK